MAGQKTFTGTQNFWELACISGLALGLPAMVVGGQLAQQYGSGTALISVCIGNVLLWMIGHGILSMSEGKNHAIENVKGYLGKNASLFAALTWIMAFLIWYVIQLQGATSVMNEVIPHMKSWQIGVLLGLVTAILSYRGIRFIKRFCVFSFPILFGLSIYTMATTPSVSFENTWGISFSAILVIILVWLPGIVNLPTIFRHSKSKDDSIFGLTLMTCLHAFFQIFTIIIGINNPVQILSKYIGNSALTFGLIAAICFNVLAYFCINLVNIYFASAGWEAIIFRHKSSKEFFIVGLAGTGVYLFSDLLKPVLFHIETLEAGLTNFIASLGVVLIVDFVIRTLVKHRPRPLQKLWSSVCWIIGCLASLVVQFRTSTELKEATQFSNGPLLAGILFSLLGFLIILFIEETIWAVKNLPKKT